MNTKKTNKNSQAVKTHSIDASGKKVGRIATEIAMILMGKNEPSFERHKIANVEVKVSNAGKMSIIDSKKEQKSYLRYSGYPGGLKSSTMEGVISKKGYSEVLRNAVKGMLPKNTHRPRLMKRLIVSE